MEPKYLERESVDLLFKCTTEGLNESRSLGWIINNDDFKYRDTYSRETIYMESNTGSSILFDRKKRLIFILLTNEMNLHNENKTLNNEMANIYHMAFQSAKMPPT